MDQIDAIRSDFAELHHEMQLGFARLDAKIVETRVSLEAQIARLEGMVVATRTGFEAALEKGLREQTRFFFLAWSVLLAAIIGLYAR